MYSVIATFNNTGRGYRRWRIKWEQQIAHCCDGWVELATAEKLPFYNEEGCPESRRIACPACRTVFQPTFAAEVWEEGAAPQQPN